MKKIIVTLALMVALVLPAITIQMSAKAEAVGTTYYISSSTGSDENDGLSQNKSWKSFANINYKLLKAGDKVLLKRGDEWNERLNILARGEKANFVEISAYGEGEKPKIDLNGDPEGICILVHDFYNKENKAEKYPFRYLKINNLQLHNSFLGIFLRTLACDNEVLEDNRSRDVYISEVDVHNMWSTNYDGMIDTAKEIEAKYGTDKDRWTPQVTQACGKEISNLIATELKRVKCDLPMIENKTSKYLATGGGGQEVIFPSAILHGGRKTAVYDTTNGAIVSNIDTTYTALENFSIENCNITESSAGIMAIFYSYNATKTRIFKDTVKNVRIKDVLVTGSINGGIGFDSINGGAVLQEDGKTVLPNADGWGLIENLQVIAGSTKENGTFPNGSTGAILNVAKNFLIKDCVFAGLNNNGNPDGCGLDFESSSENFEVVNCVMNNNAGGAILIMDSDKGPHNRLYIHDNLMYNDIVDGYKGGPRAPEYEDKYYIHVYNGASGQYQNGGLSNKNIIFDNNRIFMQRENSKGTPFNDKKVVGPIQPTDGGYQFLDTNKVFFFENKLIDGYKDFNTIYSSSVQNNKVILDDITINHRLYHSLNISLDKSQAVSGKIKLNFLNGSSSEKEFSTTDGKVNLRTLFGDSYNSTIIKAEFALDNATSSSKAELEFTIDYSRIAEVKSSKEVVVTAKSTSKLSFSGRLTKDDFKVNYAGFANEITDAKQMSYNQVVLTFRNELTDAEKKIICSFDGLNIEPNAFVRIYKEVMEGKECNNAVSSKSYFYYNDLVLEQAPDKVVYSVGEDLDLNGLRATARVSGKDKAVAVSYSKFQVIGYDKGKLGKQIVTLAVGDKRLLLEVEVIGKASSGCGSVVAITNISVIFVVILLTMVGFVTIISRKRKSK